MEKFYKTRKIFAQSLLLILISAIISCSSDDFIEEPYRSDSEFVGVWEFEKATLYSASGDLIIDRSTCGQGNEIDRLATDFVFYPDETAEALPICPDVQRLDFDRFIQTENSITLYYNDRTETITYGIDSITESRIIIYKDGKWIHLRKTEDL
ncbi:hypothetical protein [Mangrovivirga cuniculi]|uniref:Lipocalin-like domain-containing protein n=1 Tax=Mangrovivirga cuniculi TaxID=2715131 RepID=A0A4D7JKF0_9BACT|nr:hypothetical protein [Mangrovivirga cuniculi]QCK13950.1 hypothetical protein DCC35_03870 [Mangrovivirga cuniculi]